jgi:hypothetical protein
MRTHTEIQECAQELCPELATLVIQGTSSPRVQLGALHEMLAAYGHAECVLPSIRKEKGRHLDSDELAAKQRFLSNGLASGPTSCPLKAS